MITQITYTSSINHNNIIIVIIDFLIVNIIIGLYNHGGLMQQFHLDDSSVQCTALCSLNQRPLPVFQHHFWFINTALTVSSTPDGTTIERNESECGQMGVTTIQGTLG